MAVVLIIFALLIMPAMAGQSAAPQHPPRLVDATKLTVEELLALAVAERERADRLGCCDWGGLGCMIHRPGR